MNGVMLQSMDKENHQLATCEHVNFKQKPVDVEDFRKNTDHFRGIYRVFIELTKKND